MKVNIGCGETKLEGFINVDIEESVKPDIIADPRHGPLPFEDGSVEEVFCIHQIEHVEFRFWPLIFKDFHRVLEFDGRLVLAYPEWEVCARYFLENKRGQKDFWRMTLYGRQLWPGDYHVTPVITGDLINYLRAVGFSNFKHGPEMNQDFYTVLSCNKSYAITREDVLNREIFNKDIERLKELQKN